MEFIITVIIVGVVMKIKKRRSMLTKKVNICTKNTKHFYFVRPTTTI